MNVKVRAMGTHGEGNSQKLTSFLVTGLLIGVFSKACARAEPPTAPPVTTRSCKADCTLRPSSGTLNSLLAREDTDSDRRVTIVDEGPKRFSVPLETGGMHEIEGTYHLANLVQELYIRRGEENALIPLRHVEEPVADRISRLIRDRYWDGLTRRLDEGSLERVLSDPKTDEKKDERTTDWPDGCTSPTAGTQQFLYVPHGDDEAYQYYASMLARHPTLVVCRLPEAITPEWVHGLDPNEHHGSRHGLLSLALRRNEDGKLGPVPYGVPGGRFNEMYGWDTYFHVRGLLVDDRNELARSLVDNQLYEVRHYGKVLNANRTYYLTRSQPPFLSSAVRAIWEETRPEGTWLKDALAIVTKEYREVWSGTERSTPLCEPLRSGPSNAPDPDEKICLAAYHASGIGEPPEVEPGHFDWLYAEKSKRTKVDASTYRDRYLRRDLPANELRDLDTFFLHDRSMRESGHDTTYRWTTVDGDECANFATIDLNALLFKYELDLAFLTRESGAGDWKRWCDRASSRKTLIQKHLYDGKLFVDSKMSRDQVGALSPPGRMSTYISATTLFPLWVSAESPCTTSTGTPLTLFSDRDQAARLVDAALEPLEVPGGLAATAKSSLESTKRSGTRQWDFPFGWAPHQILAWEGLRRNGFEEEANRLTYRWLYTIAKNAHDYHGTVPEKYDVVRRSHLVFAEYGNVGTEFSYITKEGFGWMNASFQLGFDSLPKPLREQLNQLVAPETIYGGAAASRKKNAL